MQDPKSKNRRVVTLALKNCLIVEENLGQNLEIDKKIGWMIKSPFD